MPSDLSVAREAPPRTATPRLRRVGIVTILALFIGTATLYNVSNPLFEAPDELWHYLFSKHVRERWELPVQAATRGELISQQEAGQPPLYYALGAALTFFIPGRPAQEWLRPNNHASVGTPLSEDNKNRFVHGPEEDFPYRGDYLAAHVMRFLSTLFGAGTVLFTYLLARQLWPRQPVLALGAAAINAFIPQFLYISAAVNNDVAVAFFCSALLWLAVRLVQARRAGVRQVIALGGLSGLAILTKPSALATIPLLAITLALIAWRRRSIHFAAWSIPLALLTSSSLTAWWFARNLALYGELLPLKTFLNRASLDDQIPTVMEVVNDLNGLRASFWALFGWFSITVDPLVYFLFDVLLLWAAVGLCLSAWRAVCRQPTFPLELSLVAAWFAIVFVALLRYRLIVQAFQGRLLFGAVPAIAVLLLFGISSSLPRRLANVVPVVLASGMFSLAVLTPFIYIQPAYVPPRPYAGGEVNATANPLARLGEAVELLDAKLSAMTLRPGQTLEVTLYWRATRPIREDYSVFVHVMDWQERTVAQKDTFPGGGNFATSLWRAGEIVRDTYRLEIPRDLPAPAIAHVAAGLYLGENMERQPVLALAGQSKNSAVLISRVRVMPPEVPATCASHRLDVAFAAKAVLQGYRLDAARVSQGGALTGELCWQGIGAFDGDYTIFVQLIGPAGLVAQDDAQPRRGAFPTSAWGPGDVVVHPFSIPVGTGVAPGRYRLIAGLYDLATGRRLPAGNGDFSALTDVDIVAR